MYSIVDIETTGASSKITEISIFVFDGKKVIDEYTTLVNPECIIPPFITNLTGITNAMVGNAPKFYEIAKKVAELTEGTIFVAHNVNFDYNIIEQEFKNLGGTFKLKKLCTVRLSRKLIPGLQSYSLGSLCTTQNIVINNRHRAKGDAEATTILFEKLLKLDSDQTVFNSFLYPNAKQATLPPLLAKKNIEELSDKTGVYYFKNEANDIIYISKANNIKQRVFSHFYDKTRKEVTMCLEIASISFVETGSELAALLQESSDIKKFQPKYNKAQKRTTETIGLFSYEDRNGIIHLAFNKLKRTPNPIIKFYTETECKVFIEKLCNEFELCPKYCHLQTNVNDCFTDQLKKCKGVCKNEETIDNYNKRALEAINSIKFKHQNFIIKEQGRSTKENTIVLIINGVYKGFGYMEKHKNTLPTETYLEVITKEKENRDAQIILTNYLKNNTKTFIALEDEYIPLNNFQLSF